MIETKNIAWKLIWTPAGNYMFRVRSETCSKLTINSPEQFQWHGSDFFIGNFEHISYLVLAFLLLTLSR